MRVAARQNDLEPGEGGIDGMLGDLFAVSVRTRGDIGNRNKLTLDQVLNTDRYAPLDSTTQKTTGEA